VIKTDLSKYNNDSFYPGAGWVKIFIWFFINAIVFQSSLFPFVKFKVFLLRFFGSSVGQGVMIKPNVNIKYPWNLKVGDFCWIGEGVWIDNLVMVEIGNNVCLSQGSYILTGNHNFKSVTFDLLVNPVTIEDGVWIGAKSVVGPGVTCRSHSVLSLGSVASRNLEANTIYRGNPAVIIKNRIILN